MQDRYGQYISNFETSIIGSAFELAGVLTVQINPYFIGKYGKKNSILFSYFILFLFPIAQGLAYLLDPNGSPNDPDSTPNWKIFFAISFISRFFQGASDAMLITCFNSIIALTFKEEKMTYMGYVESSINVGLIFGPPIGSLIYT